MLYQRVSVETSWEIPLGTKGAFKVVISALKFHVSTPLNNNSQNQYC